MRPGRRRKAALAWWEEWFVDGEIVDQVQKTGSQREQREHRVPPHSVYVLERAVYVLVEW
jgi:hypothetical protein